MDVRELFDIIDSFIAGFGEKDNSDTSNAIFIANELQFSRADAYGIILME